MLVSLVVEEDSQRVDRLQVTDQLTQIENDSIRKFVQSAADEDYLSGRVLDYGCGRQPYRGIVEEAGGHYEPYDRINLPANSSGKDLGEDFFDANAWDAILCTQVAQYWPDPGVELAWLRDRLFTNGVLVLSYPSAWPEIQEVDLHRFTKAGMERLLTEAGFSILRHERRATFDSLGYEWALGYGVVARA
jgi:SAM-dependent methyltransferase